MRRILAQALVGALAVTVVAAVGPPDRLNRAAADGVVIGGRPVSVTEHPWVVALASRDRFGSTRGGQFCGGVLVGPATVVTAAHCLNPAVLGGPAEKVRDFRVIVGRTELARGEQGREVPVAEVLVNPGYDAAANAGDLALLRLARPLTDVPVLPLAAAGDPGYREGAEATVYGWGDTSGFGDYAYGLRAARVDVLADGVCARAYPGGPDGRFRAESMLCAGDERGGRDACQGDSGGPLVSGGRLIGLVSWGRGCGQADSPGVYTRIAPLAEFVAAAGAPAAEPGARTRR
ncbi:S1 family serine peptidase [Streptomyces sp. BI20]|uniref:S1 family serine peptidase n=1 Tax=Streptomyces sp. BI20 TaxID=3403460 RepID=UPI003C78BAC1